MNMFGLVKSQLSDPLQAGLPDSHQVVFERVRMLYHASETTSPFENIRNRERQNDAEFFYQLVNQSVRHALAATYYNLATFNAFCSQLRANALNLAESLDLTQPWMFMIPQNKLTFEYEHFTLHSRVVLDRLNTSLNYYYQTNARNLYRSYKVWRTMRDSLDENESLRLEKVLDVIDGSRDFLDELISMEKSIRMTERDTLAHRKEINITVIQLWMMPNGEAHVEFPDFRNPSDFLSGVEADELLGERFVRLAGLSTGLLGGFFGIEIN